MEGKSVEKENLYNERSIAISDLPFTYVHLCLVRTTTPTAASPSLDIITVRTYLTSALQQFLGLAGTAIPIDILKLEDTNVWIRLPREDSRAMQGALSQWIGKDGNMSWQIKGSGESVGALLAANSSRLFDE